MTDKEHKYYTAIKDLVIGRRIKDVYYEELDYQNDLEYWELSPDTHSIDLNIIIQFDNQDFVQIKWDNAFHCYGIGLERLEELNYRESIKTIKLSANKNWSALIDQEVTEVNVLWDLQDTREHHFINLLKKTKKLTSILPQTWEVKFSNDHTIWISALEIRENEEPSYWADHLTVFFTDQGQEKHGLKKGCTQRKINSTSL